MATPIVDNPPDFAETQRIHAQRSQQRCAAAVFLGKLIADELVQAFAACQQLEVTWRPDFEQFKLGLFSAEGADPTGDAEVVGQDFLVKHCSAAFLWGTRKRRQSTSK
ncbi:hypothetical protein [Ottowia sp.]|uniref:hypothetical protein n=1 Tax=Ottowia sp. TaxID=1898956 RepID=UPI0025DBEB37|nr:hypothetical protein [Ottowia sp.]MBK6616611.1 hypothetical protein [Ottowia sp.]